MSYSEKMKNPCLYLVLSTEYGAGKSPLTIAEEAIAGGVDMLQMREKSAPKAELLKLGSALSLICRKHNVAFIVNDDPYLAAELNADGLHLGQEDLQAYPLARVREIIGKDKIIGLSTHSLEQLQHGNSLDLDYLAFGPIFPTKAKNYFIGIKDIKKAIHIASKPLVFIGGIHKANLNTLLDQGVTRIALIRDLMAAENVFSQALWYKSELQKIKGGGP